MVLRRKRSRPETSIDWSGDGETWQQWEVPDNSLNIEDLYLKKEAELKLKEAIERLRPPLRSVMEIQRLHYRSNDLSKIPKESLDGSNVTVLVRNGVFPADSHDVMRHCVGIAVDPVNRFIYWHKRGHRMVARDASSELDLKFPAGQQPENRTEIELLIDHLPEPIDLELDTTNNLLYWTDRGNLDGGNSLNRARIGSKQLENHEVLATGLQEGIGLASITPINVYLRQNSVEMCV
jgi:hypothetical protein